MCATEGQQHTAADDVSQCKEHRKRTPDPVNPALAPALTPVFPRCKEASIRDHLRALACAKCPLAAAAATHIPAVKSGICACATANRPWRRAKRIWHHGICRPAACAARRVCPYRPISPNGETYVACDRIFRAHHTTNHIRMVLQVGLRKAIMDMRPCSKPTGLTLEYLQKLTYADGWIRYFV